MVAAAGLQGEEQSLSRHGTPSHKPWSSTPSLMSSTAPKYVLVNANAVEYLLLPRCPACVSCVYAAERVYVGSKQWHKTCLACSTCSKLLDSTSLNDVGGGQTVYCNKCYKLAMVLKKEGTRQDKKVEGRQGREL